MIIVRLDDQAARERLKQLEGAAKDLRPALTDALEAFREQTRDEFRQKAGWKNGQLVKWPPARGFESSPVLLRRTGALMRLWLGSGPGAVADIRENELTWGVRGLPAYAFVMRSGARIRVTRRMRLFLGIARGFWLKLSTKVLTIPARPHASWTPQLQERTAVLLRDHILGHRAEGQA